MENGGDRNIYGEIAEELGKRDRPDPHRAIEDLIAFCEYLGGSIQKLESMRGNQTHQPNPNP